MTIDNYVDNQCTTSILTGNSKLNQCNNFQGALNGQIINSSLYPTCSESEDGSVSFSIAFYIGYDCPDTPTTVDTGVPGTCYPVFGNAAGYFKVSRCVGAATDVPTPAPSPQPKLVNFNIFLDPFDFTCDQAYVPLSLPNGGCTPLTASTSILHTCSLSPGGQYQYTLYFFNDTTTCSNTPLPAPGLGLNTCTESQARNFVVTDCPNAPQTTLSVRMENMVDSRVDPFYLSQLASLQSSKSTPVLPEPVTSAGCKMVNLDFSQVVPGST